MPPVIAAATLACLLAPAAPRDAGSGPDAPRATPAPPPRRRHPDPTGRLRPAAEELRAAARSPDPGALSRVAERLGTAGVGTALGAADPELRAAALRAAGTLDDAALIMDGMVALLADDGALAEPAALALAGLLADDDPRRLDRLDVPADVIASACRGLATLATAPHAPVTARVAALHALASAARCESGATIANLARDPDARLREAAADAR